MPTIPPMLTDLTFGGGATNYGDDNEEDPMDSVEHLVSSNGSFNQRTITSITKTARDAVTPFSSCSEFEFDTTTSQHSTACCSDNDSSVAASITPSTTSSRKIASTTTSVFRSNQLEQWSQRYQEMVDFRHTFGNCLVPLNWPTNPSLAHWVSNTI